ncbi:MAG: uroporphyrinogen decarboxylase [Bacteroidetes bacterium HGW-Bacteroidetes-7]|jgi:uroporphyrinogen decarboxylase|nr:MAG: uroporphyrinogen decarboxylase [Bacteroidetes bacterium HGW-Bacteroidetes-7]
MKGKELIYKAIRLEKCERAPWVPFVGVHGAYLIDCDSESYLQSKELIVKGVNAAIKQYDPDGIPVVFDLQLEAEALGCKVIWAKENPPSVVGHPLAQGVSLDELKIPVAEGRIAVVLEAAKELRVQNPDIALYGLVTGPFTLGLHLLGTDIFMQMFMEEAAVHRLMRFCTDVSKEMSRLYAEAGCDIIAIVDPMTSQIGTDQFDTFVPEYMKEIFSHITKLGKYSSFFVCGDAQHNIEAMCNCMPDNVSIDENIPLDYVRDICVSKEISFGGNLKLTATLLLGTIADSEKDALECLAKGGERGFILAPGCDLPYKTVVENLTAVKDIATDKYKRDIAQVLHNKKTDEVKVNTKGGNQINQTDSESPANETIKYIENELKTQVEQYLALPKVKIDVITLDSASCAPCQYMMNAVLNATERLGDSVITEEFKIKENRGLAMMSVLGVKKIPTICIDGEVCFSSIIPPVNEIKKAIELRIAAKVCKLTE